MSRKGKMQIEIPKGTEVSMVDRIVTAKGPKGTLSRSVHEGISLKIDEGIMFVEQSDTAKTASAIHGLERSLISNMVIGVSTGFEKTLKMVGTGYKAALESGDRVLDLKVMKSHPVKLDIPTGIECGVTANTTIIVKGSDKQAVGQFAAIISRQAKKDPYKGKGIHIDGEFIRRKAGKNSKKK